MPTKFGDGVPDSALIMLARLMLARCKLSGVRIDNRQDAIAVIKGLRPPVSKTTPLAQIITPAIHKPVGDIGICKSCGKPLPIGSLCRTVWTTYDGEHIKCTGGNDASR